MITTLLAASLFGQQIPEKDAVRLAAVRSVVDLARQVEAVCRPRYLTDPPTPVQAVSDLPIQTWQAEVQPNGSCYVSYGDVNGFVRPWSTTAILPIPTFHRPPDARLWTPAECEANARAVADLVKPEGYVVGASYTLHPEEPDGTSFRVDFSVPQDPRLHVWQVDLRMDRRTGLPYQVRKERLNLPAVAPERVRGVLDEDALAAEALRVNRILPELGPARRARSPFLYAIPNFRDRVNELTPAHLAHIASQEAIPVYRWDLVADAESARRYRSIWVDARTGRAMAYRDTERRLNRLGAAPALSPVSRPDAGRWRLGETTGTFAKVADAEFEGVPTVVTNDAGEVLTLRFDRRTGTARDESGTYRPEAALLRAMRAEGPVRAFGKE